MTFLIVWLLCTVAFAIGGYPTTNPQANTPPVMFLRLVTAGVLIAIAIMIVPSANINIR